MSFPSSAIAIRKNAALDESLGEAKKCFQSKCRREMKALPLIVAGWDNNGTLHRKDK